MKQLAVIDDRDEADRICSLLQDKGIPISCTRTSAWRSFGTPRPFYTTISVCLDSQFADACILLKDPSHTPAEPVDVQQYYDYVQAAGYGPVLHLILLPALGICLLCLLVIWAVYYFGRSSHF